MLILRIVNIDDPLYFGPMSTTAADLIREARTRAGLSQIQLGERAGVTQSVISTYESGRRVPGFDMMTKLIGAAGAEIIIEYAPTKPRVLPDTPRSRKLLEHRDEILEAARSRGASNVRVFGSVARGDDGPDSDFDLMVDIPDSFSLFDLGGLTNAMGDIMGEAVDVVPARSLKPRISESAHEDAVQL